MNIVLKNEGANYLKLFFPHEMAATNPEIRNRKSDLCLQFNNIDKLVKKFFEQICIQKEKI